MRRAAGELIIGYGNELRGDDAAGPLAARQLAAAGFNAIDSVQLLPEFAERIAAASKVIFIDCCVDVTPGEIAVNQIKPAESHRLHDLSPESLLALTKLLYHAQPEAYLIGIGPASLDLGATPQRRGLTRAVRRAARLARADAHDGGCYRAKRESK